MTENVVSIAPESGDLGKTLQSSNEAKDPSEGNPRAGTVDERSTKSSSTSVIAQPYPEVGAADLLIDDPDFLTALKRLKNISSFLAQVPMALSSEILQAARLGGLNQLRRSFPSKGRAATYEEWQAVEQRTQVIWAALSETQRRRFLATQTPGWISYLISAFVVIAAGSLVVAVLQRSGPFNLYLPGGILIPFLLWMIALGAIGAAASIGMNALAVQDDATFDISSGKFIWLRLVLGALFGTVLTLPLGFGTFDAFLVGLATREVTADTTAAVKQAGLLLLPFILGFSTSLVILILNRFIESVQTFFGKSGGQGAKNG